MCVADDKRLKKKKKKKVGWGEGGRERKERVAKQMRIVPVGAQYKGLEIISFRAEIGFSPSFPIVLF